MTQSGFPATHRGEGEGEGRESMLLAIYGEVARSAGGAGRYGSSPFMGRWREAPEGLADMAPPHLWGGGAKRRRGWWIWLLPIYGEVAAKPPEGLTQSPPLRRNPFTTPTQLLGRMRGAASKSRSTQRSDST